MFFLSATAAGQDTVTIAAGSRDGRIKVRGRILDYAGGELRMKPAAGPEQSFPAEKVLSIETQLVRKHAEADAAFGVGRFDQALSLYRQAIDDEPRRWVRRQIIAQRVWCYRALGRPVGAGEAFLLLIRDDPQTPYFACIPLAWLPRQPSGALEQAARQWAQRDEPAAVLLGASHLLTGSSRPAALAKLRQLTTVSDRRIAVLALAQTWRAAVVNVSDEAIAARRRVIERMPQPLAAGPYFVLGRAQMQRQQWESAALALLRVPILYPNHRSLAARALLDAGESLQRLSRTREALRLYREVLRTYPQTPAMAEAQSRLEAIGKNN